MKINGNLQNVTVNVSEDGLDISALDKDGKVYNGTFVLKSQGHAEKLSKLINPRFQGPAFFSMELSDSSFILHFTADYFREMFVPYMSFSFGINKDNDLYLISSNPKTGKMRLTKCDKLEEGIAEALEIMAYCQANPSAPSKFEEMKKQWENEYSKREFYKIIPLTPLINLKK